MTGLSPSRTGLLAQTLWRSPGSRAHCLLTCLDSSTTPSPAATRDLRGSLMFLPTDRKGSAPGCMFSSSMIPPASPLSTLRCDPSRNHRQDSRPEWSRFSFPWALASPTMCRFIPALSVPPSHVPAESAEKLKMNVLDLMRQCNGQAPPSKALVKGPRVSWTSPSHSLRSWPKRFGRICSDASGLARELDSDPRYLEKLAAEIKAG